MSKTKCPTCGHDVKKMFDEGDVIDCPNCKANIYKCGGCDEIHKMQSDTLYCPVCQMAYCEDCGTDDKFHCAGCSQALYYNKWDHELVTTWLESVDRSEFEEDFDGEED